MKHHTSHRTAEIPKWYQSTPVIDTGLLTKVYLGIVKDSQDPQKMGRLLVWISELGGDGNKPENWTMCSYGSPFAGATFFDIGIHDNQREEAKKLKDISRDRTPEFKELPFASGRQSYGMWFVPPDIGNEVLVVFLNGDPNRAVWISCLYHQDTNHMVPGVAQDTLFAGEDTLCPDEVGPSIEHDARKGFPANPQRKAYRPLRDGLKLNQGLDADGARGQNTSSAQREAPSEVFGILTPDGNSFVMDDGVVNLNQRGGDRRSEELIRLRTKSGVQLLLHQSNGFIYMISKDGKTWIELSNDGDIDIYGTTNVSIHAERGNINLKAGSTESDINIQAGRDINIRAGRDLRILSERDTHINVNENMKTTVGFIPITPDVDEGTYDLHVKGAIQIETDDQMSQRSATDFGINSGAEFGITAVDDIREQASNVFMNSGPGPQALEVTDADFSGTFEVTGPTGQASSTSPWEPGEPYIQGTNIVPRVPQHEPWKEHTVEARGFREKVVESPLGDEKPGSTSADALFPLPFNDANSLTRALDGVFNAAGLPEFPTIKDLPPESFSPPAQHQISEAGIDLIKKFEGNELTTYQDVAGLNTIGVGHLITAEEKASGVFTTGKITNEQSTELLLADLENTQRGVRGCLKQPVTQEQYDAMVSMAFNIGTSGFCNSTLVKKINEGSYQEVPNQMMRWTKARVNGTLTPVQGLINRRQAEANLFAASPAGIIC